MEIKLPICIFFFNRPQKLRKLLKALSNHKIKKIYFVGDGPRNPQDSNKIEECHRLIDEFYAAEEKYTHFSKINLGCGKRLSSGLDYFFSKEDFGFIFEDDIIPLFSLTQLNDLDYISLKNKGITHIGLFNPLSPYDSTQSLPEQKITFKTSKKFFFIWGWATWSEVWSQYKYELDDRSKFSTWWQSLRKLYTPMNLIYYLTLKKVSRGDLNTWDLQYFVMQLKLNGKALVPTYSLIQNIGDDDEATHTQKKFRPVSIPNNIKKLFNLDLSLTIHFLVDKIKANV
jgi:hypothetical protein